MQQNENARTVVHNFASDLREKISLVSSLNESNLPIGLGVHYDIRRQHSANSSKFDSQTCSQPNEGISTVHDFPEWPPILQHIKSNTQYILTQPIPYPSIHSFQYHTKTPLATCKPLVSPPSPPLLSISFPFAFFK
jgi:hypothetical protein